MDRPDRRSPAGGSSGSIPILGTPARGVHLGHEKVRKFELRVLAAEPRRTIHVEQTHSAGDVVTVEGVLLDPDRGDEWRLPFCAVLTWRDGKVVRDNTYADMSRWPSVS